MAEARNVLGGPLEECGTDPLTGWTRSGCCETGPEDTGSHTVCAVVTEPFLRYSLAFGNDLVTPRPGFPGLQPGDRWCLCAPRWQQALQDGLRPLRLAGAMKVAEGITTLDEVLRSTPAWD